jgi:hypothetical protein
MRAGGNLERLANQGVWLRFLSCLAARRAFREHLRRAVKSGMINADAELVATPSHQEQ